MRILIKEKLVLLGLLSLWMVKLTNMSPSGGVCLVPVKLWTGFSNLINGDADATNLSEPEETRKIYIDQICQQDTPLSKKINRKLKKHQNSFEKLDMEMAESFDKFVEMEKVQAAKMRQIRRDFNKLNLKEAAILKQLPKLEKLVPELSSKSVMQEDQQNEIDEESDESYDEIDEEIDESEVEKFEEEIEFTENIVIILSAFADILSPLTEEKLHVMAAQLINIRNVIGKAIEFQSDAASEDTINSDTPDAFTYLLKPLKNTLKAEHRRITPKFIQKQLRLFHDELEANTGIDIPWTGEIPEDDEDLSQAFADEEPDSNKGKSKNPEMIDDQNKDEEMGFNMIDDQNKDAEMMGPYNDNLKDQNGESMMGPNNDNLKDRNGKMMMGSNNGKMDSQDNSFALSSLGDFFGGNQETPSMLSSMFGLATKDGVKSILPNLKNTVSKKMPAGVQNFAKSAIRKMSSPISYFTNPSKKDGNTWWSSNDERQSQQATRNMMNPGNERQSQQETRNIMNTGNERQIQPVTPNISDFNDYDNDNDDEEYSNNDGYDDEEYSDNDGYDEDTIDAEIINDFNLLSRAFVKFAQNTKLIKKHEQ